jgi:hypothetical protein
MGIQYIFAFGKIPLDNLLKRFSRITDISYFRTGWYEFGYMNVHFLL